MKLRFGVVGVAVCAFVACACLAISAGKTHIVHAVAVWSQAQLVLADGGTPPPPWPGCGCFASDAVVAQPAPADATVADGGTPPPPWPGCGCFAPDGGTPEPMLSGVGGVELADGGTPPPPWPGCGCFVPESEASLSPRARSAA